MSYLRIYAATAVSIGTEKDTSRYTATELEDFANTQTTAEFMVTLSLISSAQRGRPKVRKLILSALISGSLFAAQGAYRNGYHFRRWVRIDHTKLPMDEPDFPVLLDLSRLGYADVVFSRDSFGIIPIHAENDKFDRAVYWVTVPMVSGSKDTVFYMFYSKVGR